MVIKNIFFVLLGFLLIGTSLFNISIRETLKLPFATVSVGNIEFESLTRVSNTARCENNDIYGTTEKIKETGKLEGIIIDCKNSEICFQESVNQFLGSDSVCRDLDSVYNNQKTIILCCKPVLESVESETETKETTTTTEKIDRLFPLSTESAEIRILKFLVGLIILRFGGVL